MTSKMEKKFDLKIYADSEERFIEWQGSDYTQLTVTYNLNECLSQSYKVIIVDAFCENPNYHTYNSRFLNFNWQDVDLVIIKETLWASYQNIYENFVLKNKIKKFIISSYNSSNNNNIFVPYFFLRPVNYSKIEETSNSPRKYLFESLMGSPRPHRFFVLGKLLKNKNLLDNSVVTFRKEFLFNQNDPLVVWNNLDVRIKQLLNNTLTHPFISKTMDESWENVHGKDFNRKYFLDGIDIPWKVYANTWYSICTETDDHSGDFNGDKVPKITEKTCKPILAKRVFVMFGHCGVLKLLKELGFKTFNTIIDESYDLEIDPILRFEKAFEQVERLFKLNPADIYEHTKEIREHNFLRIFKLRDELRNKSNKMLINMIPEKFCS